MGRKECSVKCEVWRNQWEVRSVKCGVWSVKCGVWSLSLECEERSVKCEVWSVRFGVWRKQWEVRSVECEVWSVECESLSLECEERSVKCEVWSVRFGVWRKQWEVRSVECEVWSVECEVWSLECEECSVQCEVWSVKRGVWSVKTLLRLSLKKSNGCREEGHGRDRLSLNYRSFMFGKLPPPACPDLCYGMVWMYVCMYVCLTQYRPYLCLILSGICRHPFLVSSVLIPDTSSQEAPALLRNTKALLVVHFVFLCFFWLSPVMIFLSCRAKSTPSWIRMSAT